jgi:hypothetical protein
MKNTTITYDLKKNAEDAKNSFNKIFDEKTTNDILEQITNLKKIMEQNINDEFKQKLLKKEIINIDNLLNRTEAAAEEGKAPKDNKEEEAPKDNNEEVNQDSLKILHGIICNKGIKEINDKKNNHFTYTPLLFLSLLLPVHNLPDYQIIQWVRSIDYKNRIISGLALSLIGFILSQYVLNKNQTTLTNVEKEFSNPNNGLNFMEKITQTALTLKNDFDFSTEHMMKSKYVSEDKHQELKEYVKKNPEIANEYARLFNAVRNDIQNNQKLKANLSSLLKPSKP